MALVDRSRSKNHPQLVVQYLAGSVGKAPAPLAQAGEPLSV